jgi:charged multivesicular body protein 3
VRKWQRQLKSDSRLLDREVRTLDQATANTRKQLKQLANKGEIKNARILARQVVRTNKQRDRLITSKARLNSIGMQLQHQLGASFCLSGICNSDTASTATLKITGQLQKSTEIMKLSNSLIRLPELSNTMRNMSMEMSKVRFASSLHIVPPKLRLGKRPESWTKWSVTQWT